MISDRQGNILIDAVLFLCVIAFLIALLVTLLKSYPTDNALYHKLLDDKNFEAIYYE